VERVQVGADLFDWGKVLHERNSSSVRELYDSKLRGGDQTCEAAAPVSSTWLLVERGSPVALFVRLSALLMVAVVVVSCLNQKCLASA